MRAAVRTVRVAMLHAVARDLGKVVGNEGVGPEVESRQLAENGDLLLHHARGLVGEPAQPSAAPGGGPRGGWVGVAGRDRPLAQRRTAPISVGLSMKYWRCGAAKIAGVGRGRSCVATFQSGSGRGSVTLRSARASIPARPGEGGRHVQVRVSVVDARRRCRPTGRRRACRSRRRCRRGRPRPSGTGRAGRSPARARRPSVARTP